jgi:hypothetical protein
MVGVIFMLSMLALIMALPVSWLPVFPKVKNLDY